MLQKGPPLEAAVSWLPLVAAADGCVAPTGDTDGVAEGL